MKRALVAAMLSALATGAVLATVGFGADSTATTAKKKSSKSAQTTQSGPPKTLKQVYDEQQARRAAQDKKLADALGVSVEKLTAAQDKLFKDRLDADVKANRLTQAQADALLACKDKPLTCDRSNLPAGGPGRHKRGEKPRNGVSTYAADLAKELGIDEAKVESALKSTLPARPNRPGGKPTAGGMPTGGGMPGGDHHGRGGHGGGPGGHGGGSGGPGGGPGGPGAGFAGPDAGGYGPPA